MANSGLSLTGGGLTITDPPAVAASVVVGTTTITGGSSGSVLVDNAGVLGEQATTGTGNLVRATSPTLVTPTLGVAVATSVQSTGVAWASKPSSGNAGTMIYVNNVGTKGSFWMDTGSGWMAVNGRATLASLDAPSGSITTESIALQYLMPAAFWQVGDRLRIRASIAKTGTAGNATMTLRVGTNGTTADTAIISALAIATTTQVQAECEWDILLISATSAQIMARRDLGVGGASTSAVAAATTISNVSNSLWIDVGPAATSTDSVVAQQIVIEYISGMH